MKRDFSLLALTVFATVCGCGDREKPEAIPHDAGTAIESFQSQALAALPEALHAERRQFVVDTINDREHLHAAEMAIEACFQRIDGTLSLREREESILFGEIDDLRNRFGDCWEVTSFGRFGSGIEGYLDRATGKLLLLWIVPEG